MKFVAKVRQLPRKRVVLFGIIGVVAVGGLIATVAILPSITSADAEPSKKPGSTTAPTQPVTVHVPATFANWDIVGTGGPAFSAEYGAAAEDGTSLRVDGGSESVSSSRSLQQLVPVEPLTTYTFSARVSGTDASAKSSGVAVLMGSTAAEQHDLPAATASWAPTTWTHTTAKNETELSISLVATAARTGVRIDELTMVANPGQPNMIENGSFEEFSAPTQITNSSLIMKSGDALLGLAWRTPSVTWNVTDETGTAVANGELPIANGLGMVPLDTLPQGYYNASLASSDGAIAAQQVSFMVLDDPEAPSVTDDRFGIGVHINVSRYNGSEDEASQLGYRHARTDAYWEASELAVGEYTFPKHEDVKTQRFADKGITMLPISVYANKLYDEGRTPSSPAGIAAYAAYTNAVVGHFSPDAIEVNNEFNWNLNTSLCGKTASCYLEMLQPTVDKVRAEHPGTDIVGPATAHMDDAFMTELYQAGGLNYLDVISFHPYDELNAGAETMVPVLQQATERIKEYNNGETKPIWLTEMGWTSGKVGELNQANYLVRGQTIAFANGVERFYWYDLVNDNLDITDGEGNFGLLRQFNNTVPAFAPKPAAMAQAMLARKIADKDFAEQDAVNDATYSYAFGTGASTTRVAWATSPTTVTYASKKPVTVTTQFGKTSVLEPTKGLVTITLTDQVVYLDGALSDAAITASE